MDLLTYAVNRKLIHSEDPLLEYVARRKDVPVDILERSFDKLLEPLEDRQSTMLVEDYLKMLDEYVPIQYTGNQHDGNYKAAGEISESLLEAINLVHGKGQEEVISEFVAEGTKQITNRSVNVGEISLKELTAQMEDLTDGMGEIKDFEESTDYEEPQDVIESNNEESIGNEELGEEEIENLAEEVVGELFREGEEGKVTEGIVDDEEVTETNGTKEIEENVSEEEFPQEEGTGPYEENVVDMTDEELEIVESKMLMEGIKRVYARLVEDLKAYGLDKSLGLSI